MTARIVWCHLGDCDRERTADLLARNAPDQGVVAMPGYVDTYADSTQFARELLVALGKPVHLVGNASSSIDPWTIVPIWFTAANITDLIVVDAQRLGAGRVADIISLACETNTTVWFLTHNRLRGVWQAGLVDWPVERVDWSVAATQMPIPVPVPAAVASAPPFTFTDLPASDLWSFRADCAKVMTADAFEAMDALFTAAALDAVSWGVGVDGEKITARITDIFASYPDRASRIVALRGFQVGMLRNGWHVGVAYDGLATFAGAHPGRIVDDEDERWERLTRWWQPHRGAVCALVAIGLEPSTIVTLPLSAIGDTTVGTPDGPVDVPRPARLPITAQRLARLAEGAGPDDPFIVLGAATDGDKWVRDIVNAAVDADAVIPVPGDGSRMRWHSTRDVGRSIGLRINALGDHSVTAPVAVTPPPAGCSSVAVAPVDGEPFHLDGEALGRRRLELGITQRLLSRRVGVNESVIRSLERGHVPKRMTATHVTDYAAALGIHPAEVFGGRPPHSATPAPDTAARPDSNTAATDAAELGALLWTCEEAVPGSAICEVLGWDTGRVTAAAVVLDASLRPAGLRLLSGPGEFSIVAEAAAVPPRDQVAAVVRRQQLRGAVGLHRVKILCEVANGTFRGNRNAKPHTVVHLRFLARAELITFPDGSSTPTLADDVAFSLLIDAPATAGRAIRLQE